ncbi:MAG: thermonuclease family protein [Ferruginibacter sp.]
MAFILIKGSFYILGKQPDGDSVRFKPNNKNLLKKLTTEDGKPVIKDLTSATDGTVQLRIESIDALETHYQGKHQPIELAKNATLHILGLMGFKNVQLGPSQKEVTAVSNDGVEGYILTRYIDNPKYNRPVSFVFPGKTSLPDGKDNVFLSVSLLKNSINYKMMQAGFVYPVYYNTLFFDLRNEFNKALKLARSKKKNIWNPAKGDKTNKGFSAVKMVDLEDKEVIFPKMFRRLADYYGDKKITYPKSLKNFKEKYLPSKGDRIEIMSINHTTDALDFVVDVVGSNKLRLKYLPEDLKFFQPKPKK